MNGGAYNAVEQPRRIDPLSSRPGTGTDWTAVLEQELRLGTFAHSLDPQHPEHCHKTVIKLVVISIRDEITLAP